MNTNHYRIDTIITIGFFIFYTITTITNQWKREIDPTMKDNISISEKFGKKLTLFPFPITSS
jgi:uncharacterized membrane protein